MASVRTMPDVVAAHRATRGRELAAADGDVSLTWDELGERADVVAAALRSEGIGPGDRVLWLGQNSIRLWELMVGVSKVGGSLCPTNWRQRPEELAFVIDDLDPALTVWQREEVGEEVRAGREAASRTGGRWICHDDGEWDAWLASAAPAPATSEAEPDQALLLFYTAAFSGRPNAAMLSHRALLTQGEVMAEYTEAAPTDRYLCGGPLFHVGTFMFALATFVAGGANVFVRRNDGEAVCLAIDRWACTGGYVVGPMGADAAAANGDGRWDLSTFRGRVGHPAFDAMVRPDRSPWGRHPGGYGQTEVVGMATFNLLAPDGIGEHGKPSPLVELRVVGPDDEELATGETGEICVRGTTVMNGYWNRPEENERRSRGGRHHTNDVGRFEEDGSFTFVGPKTRMLKSGAENIYPAEVEACLRAHPSVAHAAVIGVPDARWVQSVKAVVVPAPGAAVDEAELIEHCRTRIASYKKPRSVEVVEAIPRQGLAVDYDALDQRFGGGNYPGTGTRSV